MKKQLNIIRRISNTDINGEFCILSKSSALVMWYLEIVWPFREPLHKMPGPLLLSMIFAYKCIFVVTEIETIEVGLDCTF